MKLTKIVLLQSCLLVAGLLVSCKEEHSLPVFDYKTEYPAKEFAYEDNFKISYIPIETDSLLLDRSRVIYVSDDLNILLSGKEQRFVFVDGAGKIIKSFSRQGNGKGEYVRVRDVFYDPLRKEFFIYDGKSMLVLDENGLFKNKFVIPEQGISVSAIMDLNEDHFITYNCSLGLQEDKHGSYSVFSKNDGQIVKDIEMPYEGKKRYPSVVNLPHFIHILKSVTMIPGKDYVVLSESYCDTVYAMNRKDYSLKPMFVKSPAFSSMAENNKFFMEPFVDTPEYTLFIKLNSSYDESEAKFNMEELMYDKKEGKFYRTSNKYVDEKKSGPLYLIGYKLYGKLGYTADIIELEKMKEQGLLVKELEPVLSDASETDNPVLVTMNIK